MYRNGIKRIIDCIIAFLVLVIGIIPMALIALFIKIDSKGPVIFRQERLGRGGRTFELLKFRSMVVNAEHTGSGVYSGKGDPRVTRMGRILRATSLDELPQVINILRGDMALIGPRPPLTYHPWELSEYTDEQKRMFEVRPGITGWAQVHGRKDVEWNKRIRLNVWYVDHVSLWLDIKIFFMTIFKVLSNADNENTGETVVRKKEEEMGLKLMYITNDPEVALIAEESGVDRIFIDMEFIGKDERQKGLDTVKSHHTIEDIRKIREVITKSDLMVRVNPIHDEVDGYFLSEDEISAAVEAGADIIMLPYFKTAEEVRRFVEFVDGRARTLILLETPEAAEAVDEILDVEGVDEYFIGLNDLSLGYGKKFMFELLADGTVEKLSRKFKANSRQFGFGGIAALGNGMLPAEYIIKEHYRMGSTCVILSRSFCNVKNMTDVEEIRKVFSDGIKGIRELESECRMYSTDSEYYTANKEEVEVKVADICKEIYGEQ